MFLLFYDDFRTPTGFLKFKLELLIKFHNQKLESFSSYEYDNTQLPDTTKVKRSVDNGYCHIAYSLIYNRLSAANYVAESLGMNKKKTILYYDTMHKDAPYLTTSEKRELLTQNFI
jgi:Zn-dependent metalloprotease